jgi:uncharacterized iron-regulated protein
MGLDRISRPLAAGSGFFAALLALALLLGLAACAGPEPAGPRSRVAPRPETARPADKDKAAPAPREEELPPIGGLHDAELERVSLGRLVDMTRTADYVIVGESHTSSCDHMVQVKVIEALARTQDPPAIGLEMVPMDKQEALDDFEAGYLDLAQLPQALEWQRSWGYPFELYEPVFRAAREHGLPMMALNLPRDVIRDISAGGLDGLSPRQRDMLPPNIIAPPAAQEEVLEQSFAEHTIGDQQAPEEQKQRFFLIQSVWDTTMADRALQAKLQYMRPVVILTGTGHASHGWGIEHRLEILDPGSRTLAVVPWRGPETGDPEGGDLYFHCPPMHHSSLGMVLQSTPQGLVVAEVTEGSRADDAGLMPGDMIIEAGKKPAESLWDLHQAAVTALKEKEALVLTIDRDGQVFDVVFGPAAWK